MQLITIDFETYWDNEYSLSKMSFIEYIKDPRFEVISCSIKINNGETVEVFSQEEVGERLRAIDWANSACVAHNGNEFDFPLLVWVYDCHPKLFIDTLCMSRPLHQSEVGGSLKALSERYNLQAKNNTVLLNTKGKRFIDFDLAEMRDMAIYNKGDTDNCWELFRIFRKGTPPSEFRLMDLTARMICYPQLHCDTALLRSTLATAEHQKEQQLIAVAALLDVLDADEATTELGSPKKFAAVLESFGVTPPRKISKTTGKETYAFAKTDDAMLALLEHDDERVQAVAAARLGVKSTLLETRLAKMATCAELMGGQMPVPLGYHSATTGRWGGRIWNPQNLPRINPKAAKLTDALRKSLIAPPGHKVVVSDLSGIELRVNHYLWNVQSTQDLYDNDPEADLYKEFAAALFGIPKEQVTKEQRQLAKVAQLGLGFGAGAATFRKVAKIMGGIDLDEAEAMRVTTAWRMKYIDIVRGWKLCQTLVSAMWSGASFSPDPRGLVTSMPQAVRLPSGRLLHYPGLSQTVDDKGKTQYVYGKPGKMSKVYAGLMDENLVQAIARDVIAEQAVRVADETGRYPAHMVHDELVYVVPDAEADGFLTYLNGVMRTPPTWLPGIVLWSEGDIADTYGDAK